MPIAMIASTQDAENGTIVLNALYLRLDWDVNQLEQLIKTGVDLCVWSLLMQVYNHSIHSGLFSSL